MHGDHGHHTDTTRSPILYNISEARLSCRYFYVYKTEHDKGIKRVTELYTFHAFTELTSPV